MDALHVLAVRPHPIHLGDVQGLERAVEARVGFDRLAVVAHVALGQPTTSVPSSQRNGSGRSESVAHGPATQ